MMQVGKVPETLRVAEHIDLFSSYYPRPLSLNRVVELAGLTGLEKRRFGDLSGGQKQRLLFALAICGDPDLLVLDEPSAGLDVESRRLLWQQIRQLVRDGKSILLTTHYLEEADALADRIAVIDRGKIIAEGTPAQIKQTASGKRIRCRTNLKPERIAALPGVRLVEEDQGSLVILATAAEPVVREMLSLDADLLDLEVTGAGLEEAFLEITNNSSDRKAVA
jgi:ABC-2 type transport system ATP-binding protein